MKFNFKATDPSLKKNAVRLAVMFLGGILLLVLSAVFNRSDSSDSDTVLNLATVPEGVEDGSGYAAEYEERLEKKLEDILSYVEGAGRIKAMVTVSYDKEKVPAKDERAESVKLNEDDGEGGSRESETVKTESQTVFAKQNGTETPIILKEIGPKIEGVIIIAEGGGDVTVRDALVRAVQTALNMELHRIQVFKMK